MQRPLILMSTFGEWVRETREQRRMSIAECARAAHISWPRWKNIEEDEPRRQDGTIPQRRKEVVQMVARVLGAREDEALHAAGYRSHTDRPEYAGASDNFSEGLSPEQEQIVRNLIDQFRRDNTGH